MSEIAAARKAPAGLSPGPGIGHTPAMTQREAARIEAVLGPTNTGKTHLAIERMLGHASGAIGFPLRLLARENYDRVAARVGRAQTALVTGEEKILPPRARYFLCTVEAMPMDRPVDFLAIDEAQMAGDRERGHVFTERLLGARGIRETMLLGAETARPLLRRLVPEARFASRPRLSRLSWAGARKLVRLPRRSAVVAFSAREVYALAEQARRQRGGAAVVLGALSPRTRNAQVAMYQAGEVDYLIATDAIGMGLNMDIDHVAFAGDTKYDGRRPRRLSPQELAQIAGRAGRHMRDGTFGVTAGCPEPEEEVVAAIEAHRFDDLRGFFWRNADLSFRTARDLKRSLEERPPHPFLFRKRDAVDHGALEALTRDPEVLARASAPARVRLLWEVCRIPDFRKTLSEPHTRLLTQIYLHLAGPAERLPSDWVGAQMRRFDRTDGDIDTLAGRIAHVRTWTYIGHRGDWIDDPAHWRETARAIEDRLSDALHERLTQRFVDRRAAVLTRRLRDGGDLLAAIGEDGTVTVEGHRVGRLDGLVFAPDVSGGSNAKPVLAAARRVLPAELARRVARVAAAGDGAFAFGAGNEVLWEGARIARLAPGRDPLAPRVEAVLSDLLGPAERDRVEARLRAWLEALCEARVPALAALRRTEARGAARGVLFQLSERFGTGPRRELDGLIAGLDAAGRKALAAAGVRFGTETVFMPSLLKPRAAELLARLWRVHRGGDGAADGIAPPPPGRVTVEAGPETPDGFWNAIGYVRLGGRAIRADMVERLAALVRKAARGGPFAIAPDMLSLAGVGREEMAAILDGLGYLPAGERDGERLYARRRPRRAPARAGRPAGPAPRRTAARPDSPFAALRELAAPRDMDVAD